MFPHRVMLCIANSQGRIGPGRSNERPIRAGDAYTHSEKGGMRRSATCQVANFLYFLELLGPKNILLESWPLLFLQGQALQRYCANHFSSSLLTSSPFSLAFSFLLRILSRFLSNNFLKFLATLNVPPVSAPQFAHCLPPLLLCLFNAQASQK